MNQVAIRRSHWQRHWVLYALTAVMLAPIFFSYYMYFVVRPDARTNYGTLIEPQRPVPALPAVGIDGSAFDLRDLRDRWVFVVVDGGACDTRCRAKLFHIRQQRTMTGKDMDQIERVWFITDNAPLAPALLRDFEGTSFVRIDERALKDFLPLPASADADLRDYIWVIDPLGNLMLRWPKDPDPKGPKADMARLLKAASIWTRVERNKP